MGRSLEIQPEVVDLFQPQNVAQSSPLLPFGLFDELGQGATPKKKRLGVRSLASRETVGRWIAQFATQSTGRLNDDLRLQRCVRPDMPNRVAPSLLAQKLDSTSEEVLDDVSHSALARAVFTQNDKALPAV